jgi:hypothetical protein
MFRPTPVISSETWETIAAYSTEREGLEAQTVLESAGVDCALKYIFRTANYRAALASHLGGTELQVRPQDVERANSILSAQAHASLHLPSAAEAARFNE